MNGSRSPRKLLAKARWRTLFIYAVVGLSIISVVFVLGGNISHHVANIETWIEGIGPWGIPVYIVFFILATSLLMPETIVSITAGVIFGFTGGLIAVISGSLLAASFQYMLSRHLLHSTVEHALESRSTLSAIRRAILRDEFKLQALLRLTPLNPATVSYMLGAAGVQYRGFVLASLAMVPSVIVEVYFGYAGKHAARMSGRVNDDVFLHDLVMFGGLAVTILVFALISRAARRAILAAVAEDTAAGRSKLSAVELA